MEKPKKISAVPSKILLDRLKKVMDPELNISIVDLGLVYSAKQGKDGDVRVLMTLTTMGCPLFSVIEESVKKELKKIKGVRAVIVDLTFEPPWNPDMMTEEAKVKMGFF